VLNELSITPRTHMGSGGVARLFFTTALEEDEWLASRPGHFTPGEELPVPTGYEIKCASEPVWMLWRAEKSLAPAWI
jgi:hypothetical protein